MRNVLLRRFVALFIIALIFLAPSNLFTFFFPESAFVNGLRVDYLLPKVYLSDLALFSLLGVLIVDSLTEKSFGSLMRKIKLKERVVEPVHILLTAVLLLLVTYQTQASHPVSGLWLLLKLATLGSVALLLRSWFQKNLEKTAVIPIALGITIVFQSLLGLYQFYTQSSLIGYLLLGEVKIPQPFGLTTGVINGVEFVLPYGTTAHPNILAGTLGVFLLLLLLMSQSRKWFTTEKGWTVVERKGLRLLLIALSALSLWTIYLTQSVSAIVTVILGLLILLVRELHLRKKSGLWTLVSSLSGSLFVGWLIISPVVIRMMTDAQPTNLSLWRRSYLQESAAEMLAEHPGLGVGLQNFTANVEKYSDVREVVRFSQPVHHTGLLWVAEAGLAGLSLMAMLWWLAKKHSPHAISGLGISLLVLAPIWGLDHYLLSLQSGRLMGFVWLLIATHYFEKDQKSFPDKSKQDDEILKYLAK